MKKICDLYMENSHGKMKRKNINEMLKKDLYFDAQKSIELGIVDDIYTNDELMLR